MKVRRSALMLFMVMFISGLALHSYGKTPVKKLEKVNRRVSSQVK